MKTALTLLVTGLTLATPSMAGDHRDRNDGCSVRHLAGQWMFATGIGNFTGLGPITALGTMNIERNGELSGTFDATVGDAVFLPDNTYTGSVTVNSDCRGTLTFTDSTGADRTDSILVLDGGEIWAMSQNPGVLWTYRVKRISRKD